MKGIGYLLWAIPCLGCVEQLWLHRSHRYCTTQFRSGQGIFAQSHKTYKCYWCLVQFQYWLSGDRFWLGSGNGIAEHHLHCEASDTTSVNASGESGHWQEPQPRGVLFSDEFSIYWSLGKVFLLRVCGTFFGCCQRRTFTCSVQCFLWKWEHVSNPIVIGVGTWGTEGQKEQQLHEHKMIWWVICSFRGEGHVISFPSQAVPFLVCSSAFQFRLISCNGKVITAPQFLVTFSEILSVSIVLKFWKLLEILNKTLYENQHQKELTMVCQAHNSGLMIQRGQLLE